MEQIIVIAVFAVCSAVCVNILVTSYLMTVDSINKKNALIIAETTAETHKAFVGDISQMAGLLINDSNTGRYSQNYMFMYFDDNWQPSGQAYAYFVLRLVSHDPTPYLISSDIFVENVPTGEELLSLTVVSRRPL